MNYGFAIDNRTCIGCHACSVACKAENDVPLGVHRTWVKSVEYGAFPDVHRTFQVTRCNHCANPPCVRICPVTAMYQRSDGIVDFDPKACIGCKACLQACPYDAIHIDPRYGTAAKCHYCAHRVEVGLEPACVVVCPTHSIVSGDLSDPRSAISLLVAGEPVTVRRPEQGTAPKLFYIEGDAVSLTPTASQAPGTFAASDLVTEQYGAIFEPRGGAGVGGAGLGGYGGPMVRGGERMADQLVQTVYNAQHKVPWHWPVPAYLVTKAIGAGLPMVLLIVSVLAGGLTAGGLGGSWNFLHDWPVYLGAACAALAFTGITAALLVLDLERPARFLSILLRPQWGSWLTRGAFILVGYTLVLLGWIGLEIWLGVANGLGLSEWLPQVRLVVLLLLSLSGIATAAYSGYLFAQAEGRDLWQDPWLPLHLTVQAVMAGAGMFAWVLFATRLIVTYAPTYSGPPDLPPMAATVVTFTAILFIAACVADLALVIHATAARHASHSASLAAREIRSGRYRRKYWWGSIVLGHLVPIALAMWGLAGLVTAPQVLVQGHIEGITVLVDPSLDIIFSTGGLGVLAAAVLAIAGLYVYELIFIAAPQEIPNS
jgi:Fe-S-cluster-containing dehydrogenase component/formate-dependent nitrite reductase membrane component NrfD